MKPHLKLTVIAGRPVTIPAAIGNAGQVEAEPVRRTSAEKIIQARVKFGRGFAHETAGNFLRHPEPVLSRYHRRADWRNYDPKKPRPV